MRAERKTVTEVEVETPARLHLGFIDLCGDLDRHFGSIGLTLSDISTRLVVRSSISVSSLSAAANQRADRYAARLAACFGIDEPFSVIIEREIPGHAGLGSGTQLALAVGTALARLFGKQVSTEDIAIASERGKRSGIGIGVFDHGGFIVDLGRGAKTQIPPVLTRLEFPADWGIILVRDDEHIGIFGEDEKRAFSSLAPMHNSVAAALSHHVLMGVIPALMESDFARFGESLTYVQEVIGEYFAPFQGGSRFTSSAVGKILSEIKSEYPGVAVGQSSWGPTGFIFCPSQDQTAHILTQIGHSKNATGLRLSAHQGRNEGASIRCQY